MYMYFYRWTRLIFVHGARCEERGFHWEFTVQFVQFFSSPQKLVNKSVHHYVMITLRELAADMHDIGISRIYFTLCIGRKKSSWIAKTNKGKEQQDR